MSTLSGRMGFLMNRFQESLTGVCREHLLDEKLLFAPSLRVGHSWLETAARSGQPLVNVRVTTLRSAALELAAPILAETGLRWLSLQACQLVLERVLHECAGRLQYLSATDAADGLCATILSSLTELRLCGVTGDLLRGDAFEAAAKGADLRLLSEEYERALAAERGADWGTVLQAALRRLTEDSHGFGAATLLLVPQDLEGRGFERKLLAALPSERMRMLVVDLPTDRPAVGETVKQDLRLLDWLLAPTQAPRPCGDNTAKIIAAVGEVNEVRAALRSCLAEQIPWDNVELLYTDADTYVSLIYETLCTLDLTDGQSVDELPVTFAEGIPSRYSRPGRALRLWLQWIAEGFPQRLLESLLVEGLLAIPVADDAHGGFARLARLLRAAAVGSGRPRYLLQIRAELERVKAQAADAPTVEPDPDRVRRRREAISRDLRDLQVLERLVESLLELTPSAEADGLEILASARKFLERSARNVNQLDRYAAGGLVEAIADVEATLTGEQPTSADLWDWLRDLPQATRILGSGPRPGRLHVDSVFGGGHSGRPHTWILGLDDTRFPGAGLPDPLLLDAERRAVSVELQTASARLEESVRKFACLLARLRGHVTLSFSRRDLAGDRELFPSPLLVTAFRLLSGNPAADQEEMLRALPPLKSFAPESAEECLNGAEWWLWRMTTDERPARSRELVLECFPHLAQGAVAEAARIAGEFTAYDGAVPAAAPRLNPTAAGARVVSANSLEMLGSCPRRYFFRYGLELEAPDEPAATDVWLDAAEFGSLVHRVFEKFVRELAEAERAPEYERDHARLLHLLHEEIEQWRTDVPPPTERAFRRQKDDLQRTIETFLREESRYCREQAVVPVYLEATLGMPHDGHGTKLDSLEPIPVNLPDGRTMQVRGRIDRIDRHTAGKKHQYSIWDYKTGGTWAYRQDDPFRQGRKLQPYLYVLMVRHRLRQVVAKTADVVSFGFFFPGVKAVGDRLIWTPDDLKPGGEVLQQLCDLASGGAFPATTDAGDCTFCEYVGICGDPATTAAGALKKLQGTAIELAPYRQLRGSR